MLNQLNRTIGLSNWEHYIQFLSLRTHGRLVESSVPRTEIIYIHSKLMIIDDDAVILGSANINDRSMKGKRDSEVCVVSRDLTTVEAWMGGQRRPVKKAAHELRTKLWR
jgi:phospholipase D1/2